jgi:hypothetical protein
MSDNILDKPPGLTTFNIFAPKLANPNHTASTTEFAFIELRKMILEADDKEEAIYNTIRAPPALDHGFDSYL